LANGHIQLQLFGLNMALSQTNAFRTYFQGRCPWLR